MEGKVDRMGGVECPTSNKEHPTLKYCGQKKA
jgi:hypothetical protein